MKRIILKSGSPRRKELLEKRGIKFSIKTYDVDETLDLNITPFENALMLGLKKASVKKEEDYGSILIGCDTIVVYDNKIYGKPLDEKDAFNTLKLLSGKKHEVISGVGIIYKDKVYNFGVTSYVYFKDLSDLDINNYIKTGECFGKAGSYAIQGIGNSLIDHFEGDFENIVGLPTDEVLKVLGEINEMED